MIIVKLIGGLGNQLFQYAVGKAVSLRHGTEFRMDISGYKHQSGITPRAYALDTFNIDECFASVDEIGKFKNTPRLKIASHFEKMLAKFLGIKTGNYFIEPRFCFNPEIFDLGADAYMDGYWQTEKYFRDIESVIRREFILKDKFGIENKEITKEIRNSHSVSLHIRRGDYVANVSTKKVHGTCTLEYYAEAIRHIAEKTEHPVFYIFSDDIVWVRENLVIDYPTVYVSDGILKDYEELILMSYCKHNIIANSSFSWWGAWLNGNPEKIVVVPRQWFADASIDTSDIIPDTWIKL